MSVTGAEISTALPIVDVFRVVTCPACDYSLATLPSEGVCPECGRIYDQRFIIITGNGRGRFDTTWRFFAFNLLGVVVFFWMMRVPEPITIFWLLCLIAHMVSRGYLYLFSFRNPRSQLWISRDGLAQVQSVPDAGAVERAMNQIFIAVMSVALWISLYSESPRPANWVLMMVAVLAICINIHMYRSVRKEAAVARLDDNPPKLRDWATVVKLEINECLNGRYRLIAERPWHLSDVRVIDFELPFELSKVELLQRIISQWTSGRLECTIKNRPQRRSP